MMLLFEDGALRNHLRGFVSCEPTWGSQMRPDPGDTGSVDRPEPCVLRWWKALCLPAPSQGVPSLVGVSWVTPGFGECRQLFQGSFGHSAVSRIRKGCGVWDGFSAGCGGCGAPEVFPPVFAFLGMP